MIIFVNRIFILERTDPGIIFEHLAKMRRRTVATLKGDVPDRMIGLNQQVACLDDPEVAQEPGKIFLGSLLEKPAKTLLGHTGDIGDLAQSDLFMQVFL